MAVTKSKSDTVRQNRKQDLYLADDNHVIFIPQGWCDEFEQQEDEPECMCYAATHTYDNSPVETLYVTISRLDKMPRLTENEARVIHPELFATLDRINRGEE